MASASAGDAHTSAKRQPRVRGAPGGLLRRDPIIVFMPVVDIDDTTRPFLPIGLASTSPIRVAEAGEAPLRDPAPAQRLRQRFSVELRMPARPGETPSHERAPPSRTDRLGEVEVVIRVDPLANVLQALKVLAVVSLLPVFQRRVYVILIGLA
jgi:hypothetical protein